MSIADRQARAEEVNKEFQEQKGELPVPSNLINNNFATLWRWAEPRLPVYVSPVFEGKRYIADYSEANLKDENSENPYTRRLSAIPDMFILDGRMVDGIFWIDDLIFLEKDLTQTIFQERYTILSKFFYEYLSASELFALTPSLYSATQAELESSINYANYLSDSIGISFKAGSYLYNKGESPDWLFLESVKKNTTDIVVDKENDVELNKDIKIIKLLKSQEDKRIVGGVVLEPDTIDAQDDVISGSEIESAAHRFLKESRIVGYRHVIKAPAYVVESYIAPIDFEYGSEKIKKGSWIVSVKVDDEDLWKEIKSGNLTAFSIGGFGIREDG